MVEHGIAPLAGGLVLAQIASDKNIPLEYYIATITVLGAIYGIVRIVLAVLAWLDKRIANKLDDHHKAVIAALRTLPCQRPAATPVCVGKEGEE